MFILCRLRTESDTNCIIILISFVRGDQRSPSPLKYILNIKICLVNHFIVLGGRLALELGDSRILIQ